VREVDEPTTEINWVEMQCYDERFGCGTGREEAMVARARQLLAELEAAESKR